MTVITDNHGNTYGTLKPCPFCGGDKLAFGWAPSYPEGMFTRALTCLNDECHAVMYRTDETVYACVASLIERWNRRAHP